MSFSDKNIIFHIGMMKSASTFLQKNIFPKVKDTRFIDIYDPVIGKFFWNILFDLKFNDIDVKKSCKYLREYLFSFSEKNIIFSYEGLTGFPDSNFLCQDYIAQILKDIFPSAKILLILRKQDDLIESLYKQRLKGKMRQSIKEYINLKDSGFGRFRNFSEANIDIRNINFYLLVKRYENAFNKENLFIIPFELLKRSPESFINRIKAAFFQKEDIVFDNQPVNRGVSKHSYIMFRALNWLLKGRYNSFGLIPERMFRKTFEMLYKSKPNTFYHVIYRSLEHITLNRIAREILDKRFSGKKDLLGKSLKKAIMQYHIKDNKKLSTRYRLELDNYGYY